MVKPFKTPQPTGVCPFGGHHKVGMCVGGTAIACVRCHKTWRLTADGLVPTWPEKTDDA